MRKIFLLEGLGHSLQQKIRDRCDAANKEEMLQQNDEELQQCKQCLGGHQHFYFLGKIEKSFYTTSIQITGLYDAGVRLARARWGEPRWRERVQQVRWSSYPRSSRAAL